MSKPHWNMAYYIRRIDLLRAIGLTVQWSDHKIPVGKAGEWKDVEVGTGWTGDGPKVVLPRVILKPSGVANRLQAECPECGKVMRFCGLKQHVGSKTCKEKASVEYDGVTLAEEERARKLYMDPIERGEMMDYAHDRNPINWGDENR